jgi:dTDP-4-amino-4,6-dideoxygalactose transaminase
MSSVPIADPSLGITEKRRVRDVLDDGQLADGPEVRRFEAAFAKRCDAGEAIATSNGTTALHAALRAVGIGRGDVVVTTPFSFVATANAVRHCGATPVFADIDPETYNLDPQAVAATIRDRDGDVDAILPVHLYGLPADMESLLAIAEDHDLAVVEDAAQAHGALYEGRAAGTMGDAGCFSFYPTKNMTSGEGGMVVTDRADLAERVRRFIDHGENEQGRHVEVGHNFRMTSIAAAIGRVQLDRLPEFTRLRRENAARLTDTIADVPGIKPPTEPHDRRHVYHQYTVRCAHRERVKRGLAEAGVDSAVYYPTPIHRQPAFDDGKVTLPRAERAAADVLSLPVHPSLTPDQIDTVGDALREAVGGLQGVSND